MPSLFPQLFAFSQLAPFMLRLVLGAIFAVHGYPKLFKQFSGTAQFFESIGIRPGKLWVAIVGVVEFFGGLLLLAGFLTQLVVALLAVEMLVAIWKVGLAKGFAGGWEFEATLLAALLSLLVLGPGAFSFDLPL